VPLALDLRSGEIQTIVWATRFRLDQSWLNTPVFDRKGRVSHDGGVNASLGLHLMGMPFLRRRKSSLIDGTGTDAAELTGHLVRYSTLHLPRELSRATLTLSAGGNGDTDNCWPFKRGAVLG